MEFLKSWKVLRRLSLAASFLVEGFIFWFMYLADPIDIWFVHLRMHFGFWTTLITMGATAVSFFLLTCEVALHMRGNGRIKEGIDVDDRIFYQVGQHLKALWDEFHEPEHRGSWRRVWIPILIAVFPTIWFVGLAVWFVAEFPVMVYDQIVGWCMSGQNYVDHHAQWLSWLADPVLSQIPNWIGSVQELIHRNVFVAFGLFAAIWLLLASGIRFAKWMTWWWIAYLLKWATRLFFIGIFFAISAAGWFDWARAFGVVYSVLPSFGLSNNLPAVLYLGLLLAIPPVLELVSEWRRHQWVLVTDVKTDEPQLYISTGVFDYELRAIFIGRTVEARVAQGFWAGVFAFGNVELHETSGGEKGTILQAVWDPRKLRKKINRAIHLWHQHGGGHVE